MKQMPPLPRLLAEAKAVEEQLQEEEAHERALEQGYRYEIDHPSDKQAKQWEAIVRSYGKMSTALCKIIEPR